MTLYKWFYLARTPKVGYHTRRVEKGWVSFLSVIFIDKPGDFPGEKSVGKIKSHFLTLRTLVSHFF